MFRVVLQLAVVLLPWRVRRIALARFWGYRFGAGSRIGFSYVFPKTLELGDNATIGHLNVLINIESAYCGPHSRIGRMNWITGQYLKSGRYAHLPDRAPKFSLGEHAAITKQHLIDCTDSVEIGGFSTLAGYGSQLITHGIDVENARQSCSPIVVGAHCLVGTRVILLGGSQLPDRSVLAAGAVLVSRYSAQATVYAGVPAQPVKSLPEDSRYFTRRSGFVN